MMSPDGIRCVALDMIGVLVQEEKLISRGMVDFFGDRLLLPIEEIKKRYDTGFCVGALSREQFWDGLLDGDWHIAERDFLHARRFDQDAIEVIRQLASRVTVTVISDMPREWGEEILTFHGILSYLGAGVYSNDGTGSKKDGRLFDALVEEVGQPAESFLLVDDRLANLERARARRWHGAWKPLESDSYETSSFPRLDSLHDVFVYVSRG